MKLYPCCYATHRIIAAACEVRHALTQATRIVLRVPPETMRPLRIVDPKSGSEAQFCASYVLAVALERGTVDLTDFTDAAAVRPEIRALMGRIQIEVDAPQGRPLGGLEAGEVVVELHDDQRCLASAKSVFFPGSPEMPASAAQVVAKIADCAAAYTGPDGRRLSGDDLRANVRAITGQTAARTAA
jgi:2-methylcitrate dehydratase PrpD